MILFVISLSLNLLKVFPLPKEAVPLENLNYFYKPVLFSKSCKISIKKINVFDEGSGKILSINTRGENGFYFSKNMKYAVGIRKNVLNFYEKGKFIRNFGIKTFYGGHFSKDKFIARVKDGVISIDKKGKKFYRGLIDLYYLEDGILKIAPNRIWVEGKEEVKALPFPPYIRKISISPNIISYATKNEIYLYNQERGLSHKIKVRGSITSLFAGEKMVFVGISKNGKSGLLVFDFKGNKIAEKHFERGFISRIYQDGKRVYILKDKNLIVFEIK